MYIAFNCTQAMWEDERCTRLVLELRSACRFCKYWNLIVSIERSEVLLCIEDLYIKMYRNKLQLLNMQELEKRASTLIHDQLKLIGR